MELSILEDGSISLILLENCLFKQDEAASSQTTGMQSTGMPLAGIILAIWMLIGGFINNRKK